ncbi:MFS transporter [Actinoallomurus soli]|uniref:MFS transporter n=1 Tax=Actinoallomurus soli TaxID=2952535 RepID=UPI002093CFAC|nr:MFS transporter [Actinoallomurus soli]MCO5967102.1 MFS transporter [Actinoallomurus soli]
MTTMIFSGRAPAVSATEAKPAHAPFAATLVTFVATALLATGQLYGVIPLLGAMGREWHAPASALTWMASAFGFGYAAGFLVFGPLSGRFGRRRTIVTGISATAVTTALVALAPGLGAAIALRVLQGVTTAAFAPVAFTYIAERAEPRHRPTLLSAVIGAFLASAVFGQLAAQGIATVAGWRAVFAVFAVAFALVAAALRRVMLPGGPGAAASPLDAYRAMPGLLADRRLVPLYLATPVVLGSFVALYTGLALTGAAGGAAALLTLRAAALPAILAIPFVTPALQRVPGARRATGALTLSVLSAALIGLAHPGTLGLAILLNVFVAGIGLTAPALIETIGGRAGAARGTAVSLFTFILFVGASVGPQVAGALSAHGLPTLAYVLAALLAAGAALTLTARR